MRKRIAKIFRWIANQLDRQPKVDGHLPIEFIETRTLAEEIQRRNDVSVIYWGRVSPKNQDAIDGHNLWRMKSSQFEQILKQIAKDIGEYLSISKAETFAIGAKVKISGDGCVIPSDSIGYIRKRNQYQCLVCDTPRGKYTWGAWVKMEEIEVLT